MRLWKIIVVATVVEADVLAAAAAILGLGGGWNGWLDILNQFAPLWFALCLLAAPSLALLREDGWSRRGLIALAIAGALASGWSVVPEFAAALTLLGGGAPGAAPLKIVTFNTWSDNATPQAVTAAVRKADPEVVALVEMSWALAHQDLKTLADAYPYRTTPRQGCPWDIQLLSKRPFSAYGCEITESASRPGLAEGIVWGRTTAPDGRPFTLATTHYAWPFPGGGQGMQRAALARWGETHAGEDLILTGDSTQRRGALRCERRIGRCGL